ncbi:hypothetical protein AB9P05_00235 [Roseivirga sp. BDSF3-8]|uniref:hypothetical protein n=1 Tax=Roseivirga sp. BDSF3-8 TaxID=3241598 RepID=UPI00353271FF
MKKLKLTDLKVQSMVTKSEMALNKGGVTGDVCYTDNEWVCNSGTCTKYAPCVPPLPY